LTAFSAFFLNTGDGNRSKRLAFGGGALKYGGTRRRSAFASERNVGTVKRRGTVARILAIKENKIEWKTGFEKTREGKRVDRRRWTP